MIALPPAFTASITARFGSAGETWLASLPDLMCGLCGDWHLEVEGEASHGTWGLAVPVRWAGLPAVLKVAWPGEEQAHAAAALSLWDGDGAVKLFRADLERQALLLERLDASTSLKTLGVGEALRVAGSLLRRLGQPAPDDFPRLADVGRHIAANLPRRWEQQARPFPRETLIRAVTLARTLAASSGRQIVNWDIHDGNVLRAGREPWLVIDPQVLSGDLEYGVAQWLWWRLEDTEASGGVNWALEQLSGAAALDPARTRAWSYVRTVDYWLWGPEAGLTIDPPRCERVIQELAPA